MAAWARREPRAVATVDAILARHGRTAGEFIAEGLYAKLDEAERIEALIASTEARRTAALREIERRSTPGATRWRRASDAVLEAGGSPWRLAAADPSERLGRAPAPEGGLPRSSPHDLPREAAANRRNGARSTGPRTRSGKARSSRNATGTVWPRTSATTRRGACRSRLWLGRCSAHAR
jgi:hypothetical protein